MRRADSFSPFQLVLVSLGTVLVVLIYQTDLLIPSLVDCAVFPSGRLRYSLHRGDLAIIQHRHQEHLRCRRRCHHSAACIHDHLVSFSGRPGEATPSSAELTSRLIPQQLDHPDAHLTGPSGKAQVLLCFQVSIEWRRVSVRAPNKDE